MVRGVRRAAVAAATIACFAAAAPAAAQTDAGPTGTPFSGPPLEPEFPGGKGAQKTPTPTPTPRETETATPTPEPSPSPTATATPGRKGNKKDLPNTGSDPLRVGLMGLTLLGFGLSLRLRLTEARSRN